MQCTLYYFTFINCATYILKCTMQNVQCLMYNRQCTIFSFCRVYTLFVELETRVHDTELPYTFTCATSACKTGKLYIHVYICNISMHNRYIIHTHVHVQHQHAKRVHYTTPIDELLRSHFTEIILVHFWTARAFTEANFHLSVNLICWRCTCLIK